jgi:tetratricopeptide (TPR) repeat protein
MQRRSLQWFAALVAAWATAQAAGAVTDADRQAMYRDFRTLFDAKRYAEALPLAEKIVSLTEEQYGATDRTLVNPLTNLGTVHYRMKDYAAAEKEYQRSVDILEQTAGAADRQLLRPLHGLGASHFAEKEYVDASVALKRAVDLSRNVDGLFNVEQLQILDPLIQSYVALDLTADAEKEQQYALHVAESSYGKSDVRMLKPLDRYGHWLEQIARYTTARLLYARALTIAEQVGGRGTILAVEPLQGIARTYRLEFVNGAEDVPSTPDPFGANDMPVVADGQRLNPDGERALRLALAAIDKSTPVEHKKRGETLVELGDWYFSAGALGKGVETYREAWKDLTQANATALLEQPRLLAYRPPPSSSKRSHLNADDSEERYVEVKYTVTRDGKTDDVMLVGGDAAESTQKSVVSAMKKARYAPRFENGEPADTPNVAWREKILIRVKQQSAKTS